ncbi:hypothetical protein ACS0TY_026515 [Phlomoides rotata]
METTKTTFKERIKSKASNFNDRRKLGHKIRNINRDFESINREAGGLGLPTRLAGLQATGVASHASASQETDSFTSDPVFLGRGDDVKEIVEKITSLPADQVFSILPIFGMGGMGKSTLAREVVKVQTHFGTHIWVHVSPNFDPIMLFKKILEILTKEDVKVEKVLKLSYDNLPSPSLKKCFAYCSIFPKGARMLRIDLIELWMAEGFLEADQRSDMETVGNKIFNLLLHNSLLQVWFKDGYNDVSRCSMHDLVHDVAMKVNDSISDGIYQARYTGHEFYGDESKENTKYVHTLFFGGEIHDAMFSNFKCLHALTLMNYDVKELPS